MPLDDWATNATYTGLTGASAVHNTKDTIEADGEPDTANGWVPGQGVAAQHLNKWRKEWAETLNADYVSLVTTVQGGVFAPERPVVTHAIGTGTLRLRGVTQAAGMIMVGLLTSATEAMHMLAIQGSTDTVIDWGVTAGTITQTHTRHTRNICAGPLVTGKVLMTTCTNGARAAFYYDNTLVAAGVNRVELSAVTDFGSNTVRMCVYDAIHGKYIVVTDVTGGAGTIYNSTTAASTTWTSRNPGMSVTIDDIAYNPSTGRVVVVGRSASTGVVAFSYSDDGGTTWTASTFTGSGSALVWVSVEAYPGGFIACPEAATSIQLYTSAGITWATLGSALTVSAWGVSTETRFAANVHSGKVIIDSGSAAGLLGSLDGINWTSRDSRDGVLSVGAGFLFGVGTSLWLGRGALAGL